ncbi:DMA1 (YHR115C) and DMA2 (YNL116W) [Zygosaccharomyces parabailii]|nr:DMA1 (YHR115C) and DMA2 (YNL116W) [Zygosaccharomyces parabailii]
MYNPVAFSAGNTAAASPSTPVSSATSAANISTATGSSRATTNFGMASSSNSAGSTAASAPSGQRRRRGSGLNSFLNSFGIRQNNTHGGSSNNPFVNLSHTHSSGANSEASGAGATVSERQQQQQQQQHQSQQQSQQQQQHEQPPLQPQALPAMRSFHDLPISISLTAQQEGSVSQLAPVAQTNTVSVSSSPVGQAGPLQQDHSSSLLSVPPAPTPTQGAAQAPTPVVNRPIAGIDPIHPESHTYNGTTSGGFTHTPNTDSTAPLKNLRHYIYAADQPNADELLNLELTRNAAMPEPVDEETLQQRKDRHGLFSIRLTPFIDGSFSTNPGLSFDPVIRTAGPGSQLVIGRYTERVREAIAKIPEQYHPVVFKSKVVSRTHGCFKVDSQGNWFIRDVRSSSGTFLNHQRLAPASTMSKDTLVHDGDILQLGMDFRGGAEEIYRCVKMRVEINRSWKRRANAFNKEALQRIKNIQKLTAGLEEEDCSICLSKIKPCQAMFISPCSHSWHFQCIRRLVMTSYPQFICPNCRCACDLEASLESSESESEIESDGGQLVDELGVLLEDPKDVSMS